MSNDDLIEHLQSQHDKFIAGAEQQAYDFWEWWLWGRPLEPMQPSGIPMMVGGG